MCERIYDDDLKLAIEKTILYFSDRSAIKQKTFDPVWNETFIHEVENASTLGITVFHKAPIDDVFNANATISFEDLIARNQQDQTDFWIDLEPSGRLHVKIDLRWSQGENSYSLSFFQNDDLKYTYNFRKYSKSNAKSTHKQGATIHEPPSRCDEETCTSGEWTQIYGNIFASANLLLALS